ncbi:S26 family signal peptidase [Armatimonas sp.]|uniref:S26 family signal peptidase n=1 Tax=Armatimonas sp. TaxID=1872638 RepID=UPI00286A151F|nr:S26 family signal peptidase [Armatimonas sp.]
MPDDVTRGQRLERLKFIERLVLIPILLLAVGAYFCFGRAQVVGVSMFPTLKPGQKVTILKAWQRFSPLREGDVIVIGVRVGMKNRDEDVVKRVIFIQNATGTRQWPATITTPAGTFPTAALFRGGVVNLTTPKGIYVLGDNINNSTDSRDFGAVSESEIIGKVLR